MPSGLGQSFRSSNPATLLYAGAASVLCNQWPVASESTAVLMLFYEHYRAGDPEHAALQQARRELQSLSE